MAKSLEESFSDPDFFCASFPCECRLLLYAHTYVTHRKVDIAKKGGGL